MVAKRSATLARVRRLCLSLPDTMEKLAWGAPTFRAGGRMFLMYLDNHHQDGRLAAWTNATHEAQEALVGAQPEHFFVPAYVGGQGWVGMWLDTGLAWTSVEGRIREAHRLTIEARGARKSAGTAKKRGASRRPKRAAHKR
jgi:hypothetical protein